MLFDYGICPSLMRKRRYASKTYDPSTDPTLFAWYDPSDRNTLYLNSDGTGTPEIGDKVGMMRNKKQDEYHLIQTDTSKRPQFVSKSGSAADAWLKYTNSLHTHLGAVNTNVWNRPNITCLFVAQQANPFTYPAATLGHAGYMLGGATRCIYITTSNDVQWLPKQSTFERVCTGPEFFDDMPHVLAMCNKTSPSPSALYTRFDGRPGTFLSGSLAAPGTGLLDVGARRIDTTCAFEGWIGELLIYDTAKTDAELELIRGYLVAKWGTPATPPP